jgi:hypothetical protein
MSNLTDTTSKMALEPKVDDPDGPPTLLDGNSSDSDDESDESDDAPDTKKSSVDAERLLAKALLLKEEGNEKFKVSGKRHDESSSQSSYAPSSILCVI